MGTNDTKAGGPASADGDLRRWLWLLPVFVAFAWALYSAAGFEPIADEYVHHPRAVGFSHGDTTVHEGVAAMLPGWHVVAGAVLHLFGTESLSAVRALNVLFGLAGIYAFYRIRRLRNDGNALLPTAQFALLPILFPYVFLAYTDVLAMATMLAAAWATLASRHVAAALLLLVSTLVRQNMMLCAPFFALMAAWPALSDAPPRRWLMTALPTVWPYALPVVAIAVLWLATGSISASSSIAALTPAATLRFGNLYFLLFLAALLLPLHVVAGLRDFAAAAMRRRWLWLVPLALLVVFWFGFETSHALNQPAPPGEHDMFLRSRLFTAMRDNAMRHWSFALVGIAAACGLWTTMLRPVAARYGWWVLAFVFLCTQWMIEVRYVLVPAILWLALRDTRGDTLERATFVWWLVLSCGLFAAILTRQQFP
ncbi:MAG TPA: hypothetical protein VM555_01895 [Tahibacter sp.]|nr:hypothetical protein [Tahibacter sp.]